MKKIIAVKTIISIEIADTEINDEGDQPITRIPAGKAQLQGV